MTNYAENLENYITDKVGDESGFKSKEITRIIEKLKNLGPQDKHVQVQKGYTRSKYRWFNPSTWKMLTQRTINIFVTKDNSVLILKSDKNILGLGRLKKGGGKFGFKITNDGAVTQEQFYVTRNQRDNIGEQPKWNPYEKDAFAVEPLCLYYDDHRKGEGDKSQFLRDNPHLYQILFNQLQAMHNENLVHLDFGFDGEKLQNIRYDERSKQISFIDDAQDIRHISSMKENVRSRIFGNNHVRLYPSEYLKTFDLYLFLLMVSYPGHDDDLQVKIQQFFNDGKNRIMGEIQNESLRHELEQYANTMNIKLKQKIESKIGPSYQRNINEALSLDEE